jgi:hypothetical protein
MTSPRILLYDIETSPILGYTWGLWKTNVIEVVEDWYLLSVAWQWFGEDEIHFERKSKQHANDRALTKTIWNLFDEADIVVAQNGDQYDQKKSWAKFVQYDLGPPSHYQQIDTLKMARKHGFTSKSLDNLAKRLGIGKKLAHQGKHTWLGCIGEDAESWRIMEEYNKHDVWLLNEVWGRLAPYSDVTPNMQHWTGSHTCTNPRCGSGNLVKRGLRRTHAQEYQTYQCKDCLKYSRALLADDGRLR